ncbi:hypothetical protein [Agromyces larvae]|uniref:Major facilitator superfamily (MFS) profile domain-containing protein n=1 Tax=Agromyces larvae TaxID=2929802 RepID=A0ABY4C457_9MICO|nr:hypothetical protein [Agromyces larvae]UOE45764.1 hypothetical protein MTO99_08470 [Agromyces larvae]
MSTTTSPAIRSREFFLWALGVAGAGIALALIVRLVPSDAVHRAGVMFIPLLVPIVALLAVVSVVYGVIALVRAGRRAGSDRLPVIVSTVGSVLLVLLLPVLVAAAQLLVVLVGGLVG